MRLFLLLFQISFQGDLSIRNKNPGVLERVWDLVTDSMLDVGITSLVVVLVATMLFIRTTGEKQSD